MAGPHTCTGAHVFEPIHAPSRQKQAWAEIVIWLQVNEVAVESPCLQFSSITVDSFRTLFRRLVVLASPDYVFPPSPYNADNWEVEFRTALDMLSYPFQIDPNWLLKPSKSYVWPFLLCICKWILRRGEARVGVHVGDYLALSFFPVRTLPLVFGYGNGEPHHQLLFSAITNLKVGLRV